MAAETQTAPEAAAAVATTEVSLLDQAIAATKQTEPDQAQALIKTLTEEALKGTISFSKNLTVSFNRAIALIDEKLSEQTAAILHHPQVSKLEGSWRGLNYLVMNSETGTQLKIKMLNVSKRDLGRDLARAVEFDQSEVWKRIYENEFGLAGGEPYGALIGDYEFSNHPDDLDLLTGMSNIAAASFAPFISATNAQMFGLSDFRELTKPRDLKKTFDSQEYIRWRSFRDTEDSRFVTLTMPRVLARVPYGAATKPIDEFAFEEGPKDAKGNERPMDHDHYCWMNSAYAMGVRLTEAFSLSGFCTAIRGTEGGGKVEGLPTHTFLSDDGDLATQCPTEVSISDRREYELSESGFLPLIHYKNTDYAVFMGAQSTQKPKKYDRPEATANAAISARLPYLMATSRFAHFLKIMGRDKIGSFMEVEDCALWLNRWISNYVNATDNASAEAKARYPLRDARVDVKEIPGKPGAYNAVAYLRPWLQLEELTTSMRLVANIPQPKS
jgi:type VI secretion system protein ImpC